MRRGPRRARYAWRWSPDSRRPRSARDRREQRSWQRCPRRRLRPRILERDDGVTCYPPQQDVDPFAGFIDALVGTGRIVHRSGFGAAMSTYQYFAVPVARPSIARASMAIAVHRRQTPATNLLHPRLPTTSRLLAIRSPRPADRPRRPSPAPRRTIARRRASPSGPASRCVAPACGPPLKDRDLRQGQAHLAARGNMAPEGNPAFSPRHIDTASDVSDVALLLVAAICSGCRQGNERSVDSMLVHRIEADPNALAISTSTLVTARSTSRTC